MDTINVPYNDLLVAARRLREQADIIRIEVQRLHEAVEHIEWVGQRAKSFFSSWNAQRPRMDGWATNLENFAIELENQAHRMQSVDGQP